MFEKKFSKQQIAEQSGQRLAQCINQNMKLVEKMDKKTYLKYYIGVLETQIKEASKILEQKRKELSRMK